MGSEKTFHTFLTGCAIFCALFIIYEIYITFFDNFNKDDYEVLYVIKKHDSPLVRIYGKKNMAENAEMNKLIQESL